ncbi:unnamed protein product [Moneuplotes crassus]|uniref:Uncharacterized protein n=1 Tax=Euplotes crassus TaxID=5936 RepID=A0AAD2D3V1_EUPCR|nr:unnamed protein product [Moneuplotes crassus]
MSASLKKVKKFYKKESSSDSDYSSSDQNSEKSDEHDPRDEKINQSPKKMKSSEFRKLKNSAAQKHQNKITSQDCNKKGKSIHSHPIAPKGLTFKQLDIDDTESDYSEISDLSDLIGSTIYPSERDPLTDPQIEPSDFSEPSCTSSRIEESKTGSGKPLKQAETSRITKKSGKNKGPSNYSYVQPRGADGPHSKNSTSREEKKIAQPRGAKKGRNGRKPGFKNKKIFKKKIVNSDDSSSSDDALSQAIENIIQSKPARTKKQPPPVESGLVTFGQSPTNEEDDPEEDPIKERFMNLGVSEIERPEGFPMNVDLDNSIESDSLDGYSISESSMYPSEDDSQQNISKSVKNKQATIKKPREPRGSKKNKNQKDNQGKAPANYKPDSKGSSALSTSEISESSVSESEVSSKRSDGCEIEILTGGSNPSESDFEESNSHFDYVPNEHTDSILGRFKTNTNDRSDYIKDEISNSLVKEQELEAREENDQQQDCRLDAFSQEAMESNQDLYKDQDHSQTESKAEDQQESSAVKASASGDTSALEKTQMEEDKNPEVPEEEKASLKEQKITEEVDLVYKEETYSNGNSYKGQVNARTGKRHGQGTCLWKSGRKYIGQWKNGKPEGQGIIYCEDGNMYEGEWVNGKRHDTGLFTWKDGTTYQGEFANGWRNGQGIFKKPNGYSYEGEWKDDKRHGQGVVCYSSGNKYVGQFQNGLRHGEGVFTWKDGRTHQGHYENGKRNGYGVLIKPNTGERYEGQWKDGLKHGKFTVTLKDGQRVTEYYYNDKKV